MKPQTNENAAAVLEAAKLLLLRLRDLVIACKMLPASDGRTIGLLPFIERARIAIATAEDIK